MVPALPSRFSRPETPMTGGSFLFARIVESVMASIRPAPNVGVGIRKIKSAPAATKSGCAILQPGASVRPVIVNRSCTPPSDLNLASLIGPLSEMKNGTVTVPFFISLNGPIREARFKSDGGVHDLFTITGRTDAPGCNIAQPDFVAAGADLIFRIPTPTFGAGLMEAITDSTILANKKDPPVMGVSGRENREGNAGTITRFGWKAQNKSLVIFSGEAYNVEQGVTNELFPQERGETPSSCLLNATPESHMNFEDTNPLKV